MEKNKLLLGIGIVLIVLVVAVFSLSSSVSSAVLAVADKISTTVSQSLGVSAGPDISSSYQSVNGVITYYYSSGLNQASTTVCSFKTPAATTTLLTGVGGIKITTGSTTVNSLEIGKATGNAATTTRISYVTLGSLAQVTLIPYVASTTGAFGALSQQNTADPSDVIFAPNTYLNVKYGGAAGALNVLKGSCVAEFVQN